MRLSWAEGTVTRQAGRSDNELDICLALSLVVVEGVTGFGVVPPDALWRAVRSAREVVRKKSSKRAARLGSQSRSTAMLASER